MFFISGVPMFLYTGKHWLVPKSCLKGGASVFLQLAAMGPIGRHAFN